MASEISFRNQGYDIGLKLSNGQVDQAKAGYDSLIHQIQDQSREIPARQNAQVEEVHKGMAAADPADVKSPGNGTTDGFYIFWNTEKTVTEAIDKISDYCKNHGFCSGVGYSLSTLANSYGNLDAAAMENRSPKGEKELGNFLTDMNNWLYKELPNGLEHHIFKADFNRRRHQFGLVADIDEYLQVVIREQK